MAQLERDAALNRVGHVRRWTIIGAAALTAAFAALVSAVAPGRTLRSRTYARGLVTSGARARPASVSTQMPPLASPSELGLNAPGEAPQAPAPVQATPDPSQAAAAPAQAVPTPDPSAGGGAVVSGGS